MLLTPRYHDEKNSTEFYKKSFITNALKDSFWYLVSYTLLMKMFFDRKWDTTHSKLYKVLRNRKQSHFPFLTHLRVGQNLDWTEVNIIWNMKKMKNGFKQWGVY